MHAELDRMCTRNPPEFRSMRGESISDRGLARPEHIRRAADFCRIRDYTPCFIRAQRPVQLRGSSVRVLRRTSKNTEGRAAAPTSPSRVPRLTESPTATLKAPSPPYTV